MQILERNALIEHYLPIVGKLTNKMGQRLPPEVDRDDLHSAGVMGLIDAVSRYDETRQDELPGFISVRVRGSMIDSLRKSDPCPRRVRTNHRRIGKATEALTSALSREPTNEELATHLNVSGETLEHWQRQVVVSVTSLDKPMRVLGEEFGMTLHEGFALADPAPDAADTLEAKEHLEEVRRLIEELPMQMRRVVQMSYFEGVTLGDIGEVLNLTESRICQIRMKALATIERGLVLASNQ